MIYLVLGLVSTSTTVLGLVSTVSTTDDYKNDGETWNGVIRDSIDNKKVNCK